MSQGQDVIYVIPPSSVGGGPPTGAAGGDLGGTYPNPTVVSVADVTTGTLGTNNGGTGANTLTGLPVGTQAASDNSTKAASTAYVTTAVANAVAGVNPAVAVLLATTQASDTSGLTYTNGVGGIGATFTGSVNTAITIDGVTLTSVNQRILVKNDTQSPSGAFNGVYFLTQLQTGILAPILTRALDYDAPTDINNTGAIPVQSGTVNASSSWLLTSTVTTVGTDALTYTKFSVSPTAASGAFLGNVASSSDTASYVTLSAVNAQTGTYQALATDFSAYKTIQVASGTFNLTLVASGSQPAAGQYIYVMNYGSGVVTILRSGQNINGATTSIVLQPGTSITPTGAWIVSDGANYFANVTGSVAGPAAAVTSGNVVSFNGTGGSLIQDSGVVATNVMTTTSTLTAGTVLVGNGTKTASNVSGITISAGASGAFTKIGGVTTTGTLGVAGVVGAAAQTALTTTANNNVLTVTPVANGTYRVTVDISVASATSGVISWTLSWTDSNSNAQSNIAMPLFQLGTAAPNTTFTTSSAGNYTGSVLIDAGTTANIVVKWVGGGTTSAKMSAVIERLN